MIDLKRAREICDAATPRHGMTPDEFNECAIILANFGRTILREAIDEVDQLRKALAAIAEYAVDEKAIIIAMREIANNPYEQEDEY